MPFNGQGQFTLKHTWVNEANAGTPILPGNFDDQDSDIAAALSNTMCRDGQSVPTANLPMSNFKFTGLGAGASQGDSVNYGQVFNAPAFVAPTATQSPSLSDNPLRLATVGLLQSTAFAAALPAQSLGLLFSNGQNASFGQTVTGFALNASKGANIASAATIDLTAPSGEFMHVTGTTAITGITVPTGAMRVLIFDGVLTLTNGAALQLPGGANIATQAGDRVTLRGDTSGTVVVDYLRADGSPVALPAATVTSAVLGNSYAVPGYVNGMRTLTTDTILTAFGKLQSQVDNHTGLIANKANSATTLAGYGITDALQSAGGGMTGNVTFENSVGIRTKDTNGVARAALYLGSDNNLYVGNAGGQNIRFVNSAGGLIAQFEEGGTFDVFGAISIPNGIPIKMKDAGGTSRVFAQVASNNDLQMSNIGGGNLVIYNQAVSQVIMTLTNAGVLSAPVVTQTSNERKKRNWQRLPGDFIEKLARIRKAGTFHWKKDGSASVGIGAQSREAILPEAVHTDGKGDKTVNTGGAALAILAEVARELVQVRVRLAKLEAK